ncbi:MAG TPA: gamma-glutamyltransferase family protein [Bauldia sp.]|nr:gamma-glutamyltransferase family protein [Bauldia sp.]
MEWKFPYPSLRVPVLAANCVATSQPLATQAGVAMLARGGSAVDAALAAAITLTVVEPAMNGVGGDAFAIVAAEGKLHGLNASGRSPAAWSPARFAGLSSMPANGWDSVTVPGAVSAWRELHARFGRLPFETLFEPAIRYARDGYLVTPVISGLWRSQVESLGMFPQFARAFLPDGAAPQPGQVFRCPDLAGTLAEIAATRGESFYRGRLAERIVAEARRGGGVMTADDLAEHRAEWVTPLGIDFAGFRVHELPPNGQGIAALMALGLIERLSLDDGAIDSAEAQHVAIEAMKLALADLRRHVADPAAMETSAEALLAPAYLDARARLVDRTKANAPAAGTPKRHGTVYLCAADAGGMMISLIQSNFRGFGSGIVIPGTGIALHNRGSGFVLEEGHPNRVGPLKRPLNTIIPGFITRGGEPLAAFGVMGGTMQAQGHVQLVLRLLAAGQNPQAAIDGPRWRVEEGKVLVESLWKPEMRAALGKLGHIVEPRPLTEFGASQVIWRLPEGGYVAASESRRDGQAAGF